MTDDPVRPPRRSPAVFLSYSRADLEAVRRVANKLHEAGIRVRWDELIPLGVRWDDQLIKELQSSDYVLLFMSSAYSESNYAGRELAVALDEFNNRSITPLPILLDDTPIPAAVSKLQHFDLRRNVDQQLDRLVDRLQESLDIDFSSLSGRAFEDLVADALDDLGFVTQRDFLDQGRRFDFRAKVRTQDPFGAMVDETWIIETKHHSAGRLSVSMLHQFVARAQPFPGSDVRYALITSGQITSAGREFLRSYPVRLVEGVELRRILLTRPHLIQRHLRRRLK